MSGAKQWEVAMKTLVFLGSVRDSAPPRPMRLGKRVALACSSQLRAEGAEVEIVDPMDIELARPFKPHFAFAASRAPEDLERLAARISQADCYVMVSPGIQSRHEPGFGGSTESLRKFSIFLQTERNCHIFGRSMGRCESRCQHAHVSQRAGLFAGFCDDPYSSCPRGT